MKSGIGALHRVSLVFELVEATKVHFIDFREALLNYGARNVKNF